MEANQHRETVLAQFPGNADAGEIYDTIGRAVVMVGLTPVMAVHLVRKEIEMRKRHGNKSRNQREDDAST